MAPRLPGGAVQVLGVCRLGGALSHSPAGAPALRDYTWCAAAETAQTTNPNNWTGVDFCDLTFAPVSPGSEHLNAAHEALEAARPDNTAERALGPARARAACGANGVPGRLVLTSEPMACRSRLVLPAEPMACWGRLLLTSEPMACWGRLVLPAESTACRSWLVLPAEPMACRAGSC